MKIFTVSSVGGIRACHFEDGMYYVCMYVCFRGLEIDQIFEMP